jgi:hypothetical protein
MASKSWLKFSSLPLLFHPHSHERLFSVELKVKFMATNNLTYGYGVKSKRIFIYRIYVCMGEQWHRHNVTGKTHFAYGLCEKAVAIKNAFSRG